ncbi:hypothetical protein WME98_09550 [Sorangium sp. So ce296]|uniref:hypothetical protein n=1 Tax=Sorangium sp. So ce296 TaxID=3133296 RepID=UPI003F63BA2C
MAQLSGEFGGAPTPRRAEDTLAGGRAIEFGGTPTPRRAEDTLAGGRAGGATP